ncbi:MAG: Na(+)/H(+) antiporter subunit D [Planctomycetes bacterium ADurb.Bin126]|nr:MAG: Na(+)/H(+) antiporter subunit D [Planctomycetes bacterium ADurb.Bin126]HOD83575.1 proton-conducting transporter membrane subunit [Phycisphaerae bacterium]HQL74676.1 proton-conducting transporter membrane subunit [Phycisphaerae bacterium]
MTPMEAIVPLLVALPLLTAAGIVAMAHVRPLAKFTSGVAVGVVAVNLVLSLVLLPARVGPIYIGGWSAASTLGIQINCDALAKLMLITVNLVALASLVFSLSYMRQFTKVWMFMSLLVFMVAAMNALVLAGDLFNLFVFLEVAAIASYALVAFGCEAEELEAAFKYLVLGTVGSTLILLGVGILYSLTGQLNMGLVAAGLRKLTLAGGKVGPAPLLAAACLIGGLALKAAMVPFHAWLPDAHPSAPAPISAMLSGVLIKASGVYAMARVVFNVLGPSGPYATVLMTLGALSMVVGVLLAVGQWDFKRLLAYHSISQMGYVVLALGAAAHVLSGPSPQVAVASVCLLGALFHLFNHAAFKSLLFLSSGAIEQQAHTRMLKEMGGLARRMPVTGFCCRIAALSIAGVPPFNGFFSKLIIIVGLAMAGYPVLAALAAFVAFVTLLSFVKVQRYALEGQPSASAAAAHEAPFSMGLAMVVLAVICLLAGPGMMVLRDWLFEPAGRVLMAGSAALIGGAP